MNKKLSPAQHQIIRLGATEPPFSSALLSEKRAGIYHCAGCGAKLFSSEAKYDSGTGWPSFSAAIEGALTARQDCSHNMTRVEILCAACDAHLGHVFDDGPQPSGQRYCMNGLALDFVAA